MSIDMYWFRRRPGQGNFGDELSPWIVRRLAHPRSTVRWVDPLWTDLPLPLRIKTWLMAQRYPQPRGYDIRYARTHALLRRPTLLAVGSIIGRARRSNTTVWGSGIIRRDEEILDGRFLAVRGPRTRERLSSLGFDAPEAMGDPALLVPRLFRNPGTISSEVSIIPHYAHHANVSGVAPPSARLIKMTDPIEDVLQAIAASRMTVSTSMHGLIVSHALGVPSLWISSSEVADLTLVGDDVKFSDYLSSVGIAQSKPVDAGELSAHTAGSLRKLMGSQFGATLPSPKRLAERQRDLLLTAPFPQAKRLLE